MSKKDNPQAESKLSEAKSFKAIDDTPVVSKSESTESVRDLKSMTETEALNISKYQDWEYTDRLDIVSSISTSIRNKWINYLTVDYMRSVNLLSGAQWQQSNSRQEVDSVFTKDQIGILRSAMTYARSVLGVDNKTCSDIQIKLKALPNKPQ